MKSQDVSFIDNREGRAAQIRALEKRIALAGTDDIVHFRPGYALEGGLYLQQNIEEFAALCLFLQERKPIGTYLEIGSASGGASRFLAEEVGFDRILCLDDGSHRRAAEQDANFASIGGVLRFLGNSHSPEAKAFLASNLCEPIDVAFIDGDHSFDGVSADLELVLPHTRAGSLLIFHDTVACEGVRQVWDGLRSSPWLTQIAEFIRKENPMGIGIGRVVAAA